MHKLIKTVAVGLIVGVLVGFAVGANEKVVFKYATMQETMTFDPAKNFDYSQCACIGMTYDQLVRKFEMQEPVGPWLAESWDVSDDGKTYTFHLEEGVLFHDGTELTAEDVAFSMDRLLSIQMGFSWIFSDVLDPGDVEVIDKYTVAFHLNYPFPPLLDGLVQFSVLNKDFVLAKAQPGDFQECGDYGQAYLADHDAGSGPYIATDVILGDKTIFRKFPDYWGGWEEGQIDEGHWLVVPELATIVLMMKRGDIQMCDEFLSVEQFEDIDATPGLTVETATRFMNYVLFMNNKKPPFDDVNVRRAISYAFDYKTVVEDIFAGGEQSVGPVPNNMPAHNPKAHMYYQDFDLARKYLEQSKYSLEELQDMTLVFRYVTGIDTERRTGLLLMDNMQELAGLKVQMVSDLYTTICADAASPEATGHWTCVYTAAKYPSPDMHAHTLLHPEASGSYRTSFYENPVVTWLLDQARTAITQEEQYHYYREAQRIATDEAPIIFIVNNPLRRAYSDNVTGYKYAGVDGHDLNFYNFKIVEE